jgi:hypothetical protein
VVALPGEGPNSLRLPPGTLLTLYAPSESFCTLFGLSVIGNTQIACEVQKMSPSSQQREYRVIQVISS